MPDPPADIDITRPGLSDVDTLIDLWQELVEDQRAYGTTLRADTNRTNARSWLSTRMTFDGIRVAKADPGIVGFVTFELRMDQFNRDGRDGIVENLFVREGYRGEGIGSALLERAESLLADRGVERVRLEILTANRDAEEFYRDHGYAPHRVTFSKRLDEVE